MSDGRIDAGERSLLGFYYQLIASVGIGALVTQSAETSPEIGLIEVMARASQASRSPVRLVPESLGEDLFIVSGTLQVLFQMKHSRRPDEELLGLTDFRKILGGFAESQLVAIKDDVEINHFVVVSNRPHTPWIARVQEIIAESGLTEDQNVEFYGKECTVRELIVDWLTVRPDGQDNHTKKKKEPIPPSDRVTDAACYVFPRLIILSPVSPNKWREYFWQCAREFGATDHEIAAAEDQLVGMIMRQTGLPCRMGRIQVARAVTGHDDALELTSAGIGANCASAWRDRVDKQHIREKWMIVRNLKEMDDALLTKRIILVTAGGGNGKSALLAEVAEPAVRALEASSADFKGFVAPTSGHEATSGWLERMAGHWAHWRAAGGRTFNNAIDRLRTANPSSPCLLWITIDGLDEQFPGEADIQWLIAEAKQHRDLRLILSCRKEDDKHRVIMLLYPSEAGIPRELGDDPDVAEVSAPPFSQSELLDVIEQGLGVEARQRVAKTLQMPSVVATREVAPADPVLVRSLLHPRMAGALVYTAQQRPDLQGDILSGEPFATRLLARKFMTNFLFKHFYRYRSRSLPDVDDFIGVLQAAAVASNGSDSLSRTEWIILADTAAKMGAPKARQLMSEAMSGGLIDRDGDSDRYSWRHQFVAQCLREDDPRDYWHG